MNRLLFNILLAIAWMLLVGVFSAASFTAGMLVGYLILWVTRKAFPPTTYFSKIPLALSFVIFFLKELLLANLRVAYDIITPKDHMEPGIIAVPLEAKTELEITLLANLVTLTPGTLSLDVSKDRRTLYVHALYVKDPAEFRRELKEGLEKRLLEVLR